MKWKFIARIMMTALRQNSTVQQKEEENCFTAI
jgi:hypothetical protein